MALVANAGQPLVISFTLHVPNPKGGTIEVTDKVDCSAVIGKIAILLGICCGGLIGALAGHAADRKVLTQSPGRVPFSSVSGRK
jgi:hypothetical protein